MIRALLSELRDPWVWFALAFTVAYPAVLSAGMYAAMLAVLP